MNSLALAFPVKFGTITKLKKWACNGDPSTDGGYTIEQYRALLAQSMGVTKQVWYCQETTGNAEIIVVYTEATIPVNQVRDNFLNFFGEGLQRWCKDQFNAQKSAATAGFFSKVHVIPIIPMGDCVEV